VDFCSFAFLPSVALSREIAPLCSHAALGDDVTTGTRPAGRTDGQRAMTARQSASVAAAENDDGDASQGCLFIARVRRHSGALFPKRARETHCSTCARACVCVCFGRGGRKGSP